MRVIGIDPSMTSTGLCAWDGTTSTVRTVARQKDNRLRVINKAVRDIASTPMPAGAWIVADLAVVEEPIQFRARRTNAALWMVQAAVRMALMDAWVPYVLVNNQHVKAYAGGGGQDKDAMARAAYERDGSVFASDDECDAWWLRQMALDHYGFVPLGSVRVAAAQRAWLDKVQWPELEPEPGAVR